MKALTVRPGVPDSATLADVPEPATQDGSVLAELVALGICGTDREIAQGLYGWAPPGDDFLILGHESLGRVRQCPPDSGLRPGDLVVGIVRRPDPEPCANCAIGEWDMCRNGRYTERGIKQRHGYGSERFRIEPRFTIPVDGRLGELGVLLEPASIVAKAWEHVEAIGRRALFRPRRALITGAGPIGLLALLMARQRDLEAHVVDRAIEGPKPTLVRQLGGHYHTALDGVRGYADRFDVALECTGAAELVIGAIELAGPDSVVCLTGVPAGGRRTAVDLGRLNRELVLENTAVFGSVNANRRHYELAARVLSAADPHWLSQLITRRVPWSQWREALEKRPEDVKTILVA